MLLLSIVRVDVVACDVIACDVFAYVTFSSRAAKASNFHFFMHMMPLFCSYANEAIIVWNAPLPHQADTFLTECLDIHLREAMK
jgi:diadenosine tetraphosphate (Ap4A) HIT family hydrolase